jgi:hypothetical protein
LWVAIVLGWQRFHRPNHLVKMLLAFEDASLVLPDIAAALDA